ncbi:accessory Sec system translocase SecA2, partial [Staphylococcus hyicus]|nr:accessory Sec system translocase SecA2 [Staphylococcus hyicus]
HLFESNLDYFVYDGEVVLIDRITGRMLPGTKLQAGLHQAIESKEDVELTRDMSVMATITFQNLFRQFDAFSGMSATSKLGEKEFFDLYSKIVVQIPTDKPIERIDYEDRVFKNADDKNAAILKRIQALNETKRPVLLITRTAEVAEYFSTALFELNIPNNLLIAQNVAKEAQMISEAGQLGAVTVATSMAGRGTDIKLEDGVKALGGLAVIISEHMENSRVDRQLRGRSGRQGDPGSSQIYISLEDYLVERWGKGNMIKNAKLNQVDSAMLENSRFFQKRVQNIVSRAQRVSEEHGVIQREMANEYEKSISIQRELIYKERDRVLDLWDIRALDLSQIASDVFQAAYRQHKLNSEENVIDYIYKNISFQFAGDLSELPLHQEQDVVAFLVHQFESTLLAQKQSLNDDYFYTRFVQKAILKAIDSNWIQQVDHLQQLKSSVQNRQNGQRNAIFEYHRVALESFEAMSTDIKEQIIHNLCQSVTAFDKEGKLVVHFPN